MKMITKQFTATATDSGMIEGYISGESEDRDGDVVVQAGIDTSKANILLLQHNPDKPIGRIDHMEQRPAGLFARFKFASSQLAQEARQLASEGILTSFSIGFRVLESEPIKTGWKFLKTELTEISLVSVAAQTDAAVTAVKSFQTSPGRAKTMKEATQAVSEKAEKSAVVAEPVGELKSAPAVVTKQHDYDITAVLKAGLEGKPPSGIEAEFHQEAIKRMGTRGKDARGTQIPLSVLFPVEKSHGTVTQPPGMTLKPLTGIDYFDSLFVQTGDAILGCPLASKLGMLQITSNEENVHIPVQNGPLEAGWVKRDMPFHRSKDAIFTGIDMTPHILSLLTMFERSSIYAVHPQARALLMGQIGKVVSTALDDAIITGGVTDGPQMGLVSDATAGDNAVLATVGKDIAKNKAALERYLKCTIDGVGAVIPPELLPDLGSIAAYTGSATSVLESSQLAGINFVSSVKMDYDAATQVSQALMGDFSTAVLCLWDSVGVELNPYTKEAWEKGAVDARLFLEADFVLRDPKLIRKFTITTK